MSLLTTPPPAGYCDGRVRLPVCLSAILSEPPLVRTSPNFLSVLPVAVARSSSGGVAICCVFPVFQTKSYCPVVGPVAACRDRSVGMHAAASLRRRAHAAAV